MPEVFTSLLLSLPTAALPCCWTVVLVCLLACVRIPFKGRDVGVIFSSSSIRPSQPLSLGLCQMQKQPLDQNLDQNFHPKSLVWDVTSAFGLGLLVSLETRIGGAEPWHPGTHNIPSSLKESDGAQSQSLRERQPSHSPQPLRLLSIHGLADSWQVMAGLTSSNRETLTCSTAQLKSQGEKQQEVPEEEPLGIHQRVKRGKGAP